MAQVVQSPWNRLGILIAVVGLAFDINAIHRFRMARTTLNPMDPAKAAALVTIGTYRISRNPMYLGLLLMLSGWAVWMGAATPFLTLPLFVAMLTYLQIIPEEQTLARRFGSEYRSYTERVGRWI